MKPITIFTGSTGLNTVLDPVRIYDSKNGISDLAVAADVDISDANRLSRRKGRTLQLSGDYHSLFCDGGQCLCATGTSLCVLNADYTTTVIGTVKAKARLSYCQFGDRIYFQNKFEKGYVKDSVVNEWLKPSTYVGPDTKRIYSDPPIGTHVEYYKGRMYVAENNVLWFSEPGNIGAFDLARNFFQFLGNITMVKAVKAGLFISDSEKTYFYPGSNPNEFIQTIVAPYPAIQYSSAKTKHQLVFSQEGPTLIPSGESSLIWMSTSGICYGGADGVFYNLTEQKITGFPDGITGSGIVTNNKYIGLIDP
jgi:hypothetical protein